MASPKIWLMINWNVLTETFRKNLFLIMKGLYHFIFMSSHVIAINRNGRVKTLPGPYYVFRNKWFFPSVKVGLFYNHYLLNRTAFRSLLFQQTGINYDEKWNAVGQSPAVQSSASLRKIIDFAQYLGYNGCKVDGAGRVPIGGDGERCNGSFQW